ncbi:MAG: hypothetical protein AMXMBFR13_40820 [Phycisphaerae bacterium]
MAWNQHPPVSGQKKCPAWGIQFYMESVLSTRCSHHPGLCFGYEENAMFHRRLLKIVLGSLIALAGLVLPACQSTGGGVEALTGDVGKSDTQRSAAQQPGFAIGADRLRPEGRR